jgi:hypothetical protein
MKKRFLDIFGMLLIGDGALTLLDPKRHCLLWEIGPEPCKDMVDEFVRHPTMSRWLGAAEMLVGAWLAETQKPGMAARLRGL